MDSKSRKWAFASIAVLIGQFSPLALASEITGLDGTISAVAYAPDGKTLAAAVDNFKVVLVDVATEKPRSILSGVLTGTGRVCWSPDGKTLFSTTGNEWIAWDGASGREKQRIKGEMTSTAPRTVALSPDGKILAAVGRGQLKLWDTDTGKARGEYEVHPLYGIGWVSFSPNGRFIVTTSDDRTAQLTEAKTGEAGTTFTCPGRVVAAEFSADNKVLFVVDQTPVLHIFDLASGEDNPASSLSRTPKQLAVSSDGRFVACAGSILQVWSIKEKKWSDTKLPNSALGFTSTTFSPDSNFLACGDAEGRIHIYSINELIGAK